MDYTPFPPDETRQAFDSGLSEIHTSSSAPQRGVAFTYLPASHAKALKPDTTIVEGIRGAGKSFWWAALHSAKHREFLSSTFVEASDLANIRTSQGFGNDSNPDNAPKKDVLTHLTKTSEPRNIWKATLATQLDFPAPFPQGDWAKKVQWVAEYPEEYERLLYSKHSQLKEEGKKHIILFDALDRLAGDWKGIRPLAKALFQLALDMRSFHHIRLKLFVRPDMLEDKEIMSFPDASKLFGEKVSLQWNKLDLFALLYQCIGNADKGAEAFRNHCKTEFHLDWEQTDEVWVIPKHLRTNETSQKAVFHAIAGDKMGAGQNKGYPYTWLLSHLLDGRNQVSPRSFIAALKKAADYTSSPEKNALYYRGIQEGVQEASRIRVGEIVEDYPWVEQVAQPLRGLIVPCNPNEIINIWEQSSILETLRNSTEDDNAKLLPQHLNEGYEGILKDLKGLGVITQQGKIQINPRLFDPDEAGITTQQSKIQVPDVYRVGFGMGRKGGVRPLA